MAKHLVLFCLLKYGTVRNKSSSQNEEDGDDKKFYCKIHGLSVQVEQLHT